MNETKKFLVCNVKSNDNRNVNASHKAKPNRSNNDVSTNTSSSSDASKTEEDFDLSDLQYEDFPIKTETVIPLCNPFDLKIITKDELRDIMKTLPPVAGYIYEMEKLEKTKESTEHTDSQKSFDSDETFMELPPAKPNGALLNTEFLMKVFMEERKRKTVVAKNNKRHTQFSKSKKARKKILTVNQMYKIVQNDNGFFNNKKHFMTKSALKKLSYKDKVFLSFVLKKFIKKNKSKKS